MKVHLACDECDQEITLDNTEERTVPEHCPSCGTPLEVERRALPEGDQLERCVVCGKDDFYQCTQINPTFGIAIVIVGVVVFSLIMFFIPTYRGFLIGMSVLLGLAVLDRVLRLVLPEVVVCYRCKTIYSEGPEQQQFEQYDHEHAAEIKYSE